jgi:small subunit ribosomal protein S6
MATQQSTTTKTNVYEAMFLFPASLLTNLQSAVDHVMQILERNQAEIISMRKWDERKLAYEIKGNKRGVYFLVFFRAPAESMNHFERDCNLSEMLLRSMVLRADHVTQEQMDAIEGRAQLEDEIRLRKEHQYAEGEGGATATVESRTERRARMAETTLSEEDADLDEESLDDTDDYDDREPAVAGGKRDRDS